MPLKVESVIDEKSGAENSKREAKGGGGKRKRGNNQIGNKRVDYVALVVHRIKPRPSGEYCMRALDLSR